MTDHPDIARALKTGYPHARFDDNCPECDLCGQAVDVESKTYSRLYRWFDQWLCPDCFKNEVEEMDALDIAEMMDVESKQFTEDDFTAEDWGEDND